MSGATNTPVTVKVTYTPGRTAQTSQISPNGVVSAISAAGGNTVNLPTTLTPTTATRVMGLNSLPTSCPARFFRLPNGPSYPGTRVGTFTVEAEYMRGTQKITAGPLSGEVRMAPQNQQQDQIQQQAQTQQQNQNQGGSQQNQNQFPGPQQQNAGTGTQISGRPSLIIRKTIHRRSGRAGKGNNPIIPTHAQRRNYMNYANGNSMNRRQTLRNYRSR